MRKGGIHIDIATVTQLISTLGFPIACCCALFYYMTKESQRHKEEMDKIVEALNNNTLALTRLELKLGDDSE